MFKVMLLDDLMELVGLVFWWVLMPLVVLAAAGVLWLRLPEMLIFHF